MSGRRFVDWSTPASLRARKVFKAHAKELDGRQILRKRGLRFQFIRRRFSSRDVPILLSSPYLFLQNVKSFVRIVDNLTISTIQ